MLVGCRVLHSTLGYGIIEDNANGIITVRFKDSIGGEKFSRFLFPGAFLEKHLVGADVAAEKRISQTIADSKCCICGRNDVLTESIDGDRFCSRCKKSYTVKCRFCGNTYDKKRLTTVSDFENRYKRIPICKQCHDENTFFCTNCEAQLLNSFKAEKPGKDGAICQRCYEELSDICDFCGARYIAVEEDMIWYGREDVDICPACIRKNTFVCSQCGKKRLHTSMVDSKYVPASEKTCIYCVKTCDSCGIAVNTGAAKNVDGYHYCPECYVKMKMVCEKCGSEFMSQNSTDRYCADCVKTREYIKRIKDLDFSRRSYRVINYFNLKTTDCCKLFTHFFEYCRELEGWRLYVSPEAERFQLMIMHFPMYKLVIVHFPTDVAGNVKVAKDITMSEFKTTKGMRSVHAVVSRWVAESTHCIETAAGRMKLMDRPVLLRVQTQYDKTYGKHWNGPGDYIEIGNYGDTTEFYIIGVLDKDN